MEIRRKGIFLADFRFFIFGFDFVDLFGGFALHWLCIEWVLLYLEIWFGFARAWTYSTYISTSV